MNSIWHEKTEQQIINDLIYGEYYSLKEEKCNMARIDREIRQELRERNGNGRDKNHKD